MPGEASAAKQKLVRVQFEKVSVAEHLQAVRSEYGALAGSESALMLFDVQVGGHRYSADVLRVFYIDEKPADYHVDLACRAGESVFVSKHKQLLEYTSGELVRTLELPDRPTVLAPAHGDNKIYVFLKNCQFYAVAGGSARELVSVHLQPLLMAYKNVFVEGLESAVLSETFERVTT